MPESTPKAPDNTPLHIMAELLRQRRRAAKVKPSELDQSCFEFESVAVLARMNRREREVAFERHAKAVAEAADRNAQRYGAAAGNILQFSACAS